MDDLKRNFPTFLKRLEAIVDAIGLDYREAGEEILVAVFRRHEPVAFWHRPRHWTVPAGIVRVALFAGVPLFSRPYRASVRCAVSRPAASPSPPRRIVLVYWVVRGWVVRGWCAAATAWRNNGCGATTVRSCSYATGRCGENPTRALDYRWRERRLFMIAAHEQ